MGVDAETKRRLKAAASAKRVSVSVYCRAAIDKELTLEEERSEAKRLPADAAVKMLEEIRHRHGTAKPTKKTAVDYIREGREIRDRQMDEWQKPHRSSSS